MAEFPFLALLGADFNGKWAGRLFGLRDELEALKRR
jgi:hypothetical protein